MNDQQRGRTGSHHAGLMEPQKPNVQKWNQTKCDSEHRFSVTDTLKGLKVVCLSEGHPAC